MELATTPEARLARSSLWCVAHALDASALVWRAVLPGPSRYRELVVLLVERLEHDRGATASATAAAVSLRTATAALQDLAAHTPPRAKALLELDEGAVGLAALGVKLWQRTHTATIQRAGTPRDRDAYARTHRTALQLARAADAEGRRVGARSRSAREWLAAAFWAPTPTPALRVIEDGSADRVLRADALTALRAAWIARGAHELLVIRALDREDHAPSSRQLARPHVILARRATAAATVTTARPTPSAAWRRHMLALAHVAVTSLCDRAPTRHATLNQARASMLALLDDTVMHAAVTLESQLPGIDHEGRRASRG